MGPGSKLEEHLLYPLPVFPLKLLQTLELATKTSWLLVSTLLTHWSKISSLFLMSVSNY